MLGKLEQMLMNGEITEEEYKEKKTVYVETLLELYVNGLITYESTMGGEITIPDISVHEWGY